MTIKEEDVDAAVAVAETSFGQISDLTTKCL
jgi:hypothetical protein